MCARFWARRHPLPSPRGGVRALYDDCRRWVSSPRPRGPERFLDSDGRIDRYPAQAAGRLAVLRHVAGRAFSPDTVLRERDVNEQLEPDAPNGDVAVLRRYLVDHGLLRRTASGSEHVRTHE